MRNTGLDEVQAEIKISRRNNNNLRYADDTILMAESKEELMKVKEESEKLGLKLTLKKPRSWHLVPSLHANRWGNNGNSERLYFLGPKSLWTVTEAIKLKDTCFLEEKL